MIAIVGGPGAGRLLGLETRRRRRLRRQRDLADPLLDALLPAGHGPAARSSRRPSAGSRRSGCSRAGATYDSPLELLADLRSHLVLPLATVALGLIGQYAILMRSSVVETLSEDYVTTARAMGLRDDRVLRKHALPNAMLPTVTLVAINLGYVVAGRDHGRGGVQLAGPRDADRRRARRPRLPGAPGRVPDPLGRGGVRELRRRPPVRRASTRGCARDRARRPAPRARPSCRRRARRAACSGCSRQVATRPDGLAGLADPGVLLGPRARSRRCSSGALADGGHGHRPAPRAAVARATRWAPTSWAARCSTSIVHATRVSMVIGLLATVDHGPHRRGARDRERLRRRLVRRAVTMRVADFFLVIPTFVLAIILTAIIRDVARAPGRTEILGIRLTPDHDRHRHRHHQLVVDRADHPQPDAVAQGARVRGPVARGGRGRRPHHAAPHPAQRHEPHRRQRGARRSPARSSPRRRSRSSASATRSSRRGARSSTPRARSVRPASARGGTSSRPARASCSSCSRSRSWAAPWTRSSTRSSGAPMTEVATARSGRRRPRPAPVAAAQAGRARRAAARRRGPRGPVPMPVGIGQGGRRRQLPARRRRGARDRGRVRLRQDDDGAVARPAAAGERADPVGHGGAVRDRPRAQDREPAGALPLARDLDRVPGRDERAQPGAADRRPDRRADRGAPGPVPRGRREARGRAAGARRASRRSARRPTRTSCRAACASGR